MDNFSSTGELDGCFNSDSRQTDGHVSRHAARERGETRGKLKIKYMTTKKIILKIKSVIL